MPTPLPLQLHPPTIRAYARNAASPAPFMARAMPRGLQSALAPSRMQSMKPKPRSPKAKSAPYARSNQRPHAGIVDAALLFTTLSPLIPAPPSRNEFLFQGGPPLGEVRESHLCTAHGISPVHMPS